MEVALQETPEKLQTLEVVADLLDNRFRIPFTNIRFGLDAIIGLIPYVGDIAGLAVAMVLSFQLFRHGAGPVLMLRMMANYLLDALVGMVPILGDLFDIGFKANKRNVEMLKLYYADNEPKPNAGWSLLFLFVLFLILVAVIFWASWKLLALLFSQVFPA
jgi:hypothetical protein